MPTRATFPVLKAGQNVLLRVEALPGEVFKGRVTFVDPVLDPKTRTARVRIEVKNQDRRLRPGMFVEASVQSNTDGEAAQQAPLVIPASAALFTGRRSVVYVELPEAEEPTYEARVVTLGPRMGDLYPVLAGLQDGERVVIHGAFALDADLQIQGGDSMMSLTDDNGAAADEAPPARAQTQSQAQAAGTKEGRAGTPTAPAGDHQHHMPGHQH